MTETNGGKPMRWGILGTAGIATEVARGIAKGTEGVVGAVASRTMNRARAWADEHGVPLAFGSYDELLASGEIDVIYNPLPNSLHAEWTIRALAAGFPVLCEKPLTVNADEARAVAAASARAGLPVAEAFMYRFHPVYDRILQKIRAGEIGEVTTIHSRFTFPMDDWTEHPASAAFGGGALRDVGCYCVDVSRLIAGGEPVRVSAVARGGEVDHTLAGLLEFPGGVLSHFDCSIESEECYGLEILGTKGAIRLDKPWFPGEETSSFTLLQSGKQKIINAPGGDGYHLEAEDFARAVRTGTAPRWGVEDAAAGIQVLDALLASAKY